MNQDCEIFLQHGTSVHPSIDRGKRGRACSQAQSTHYSLCYKVTKQRPRRDWPSHRFTTCLKWIIVLSFSLSCTIKTQPTRCNLLRWDDRFDTPLPTAESLDTAQWDFIDEQTEVADLKTSACGIYITCLERFEHISEQNVHSRGTLEFLHSLGFNWSK